MILRKGDKVVFLNEVGGGVVDSVSEDGQIGVLDEDGFVRYYSSNEIAPVHHEDYNSHKIHHKDVQDQPIKKVNLELNSTGQVEIDLHIDQFQVSMRNRHERLSDEVLSILVYAPWHFQLKLQG